MYFSESAPSMKHLTEAMTLLKPLHDAGKLQSAAAKQLDETAEKGLAE